MKEKSVDFSVSIVTVLVVTALVVAGWFFYMNSMGAFRNE
jgi:hypothetical protein